MGATKCIGATLPNVDTFEAGGSGTFAFEPDQYARPNLAEEKWMRWLQKFVQAHQHSGTSADTDAADTGDARRIARDELSDLARERDIPVPLVGGFVQNQTKRIPLLINSTANAILIGASVVAETLPTGGTLSCKLIKRASGGTETDLQSATFDPEDAGVLDALVPYSLSLVATEATRTLAVGDTIYLLCTASDSAVTDWNNVNMTLVIRKPVNTS